MDLQNADEVWDATLFVTSTLSVSPSLEEAGSYEVAWGEGTFREFFSTKPALAALLVTAPAHTTLRKETDRIASGMKIRQDDALDLIRGLRAYGFYRDTPRVLSAAEKRWLDVSWHDALDLHLATHEIKWIHDYSGNPKVMTKYHIDKRVEPATPPPRRYPVPIGGPSIPLPARMPLAENFFEVQGNRRTRRKFDGTAIDLDEVSTILDWTFRPQWPVDGPRYYATQTYSRGAPFVAFCIFQGSGGPTELNRDFSVYQYDPENHALAMRDPAGSLDDWRDILWGQSYADGAPMALVIAVDWQQYMWKYRYSRAYRFPYFECGAVMQTALTVATALGIDAFQTPAIDDAKVAQLIGTADTDVGPIYLAAFGRR